MTWKTVRCEILMYAVSDDISHDTFEAAMDQAILWERLGYAAKSVMVTPHGSIIIKATSM